MNIVGSLDVTSSVPFFYPRLLPLVRMSHLSSHLLSHLLSPLLTTRLPPSRIFLSSCIHFPFSFFCEFFSVFADMSLLQAISIFIVFSIILRT